MRPVNLLPNEATNRKPIDRMLVACVAFTVLVAALLAGGFFLEKAHAASAQQHLTEVQNELTAAETQQVTAHKPGPKMLTIPVVLSQKEPWHVALGAALSTRVAWDNLLRQLEYVVPSRVNLSSIALGGAGAATGAASGTITLGGNAFSQDDIAVFLSTLARVPHVSQVSLVSNSTAAGSNVQTFQISAQMDLPAALAAPAVPPTTTTTGG